jgi:phage protein D
MPATGYQLLFGGEAVDETFYADILSVTVEEHAAAASTLRLRLSTRQLDDGSWAYLEDDRFAPLTEVRARIGFLEAGGLAAALGGLMGAGGNDGLVPVFAGYVIGIDLNLDSLSQTTFVEVSAVDTSLLLSLEEKVATWRDLSDGDIIQQILSSYGVQAKVDSTPTVHQENDTTIVQRAPDLQFARALGQRNGQELYFEVDPDTDEVFGSSRAPGLDGTPQPDLAIRFGADSNLKSFTVHQGVQRPLNVRAEQIDVKANSANSATAGDTNLRLLGGSDLDALVDGPASSLVSPRDAPAQMLVLGPPTSDQTELQTIAQAVRDEAGWFITASGEVNTEAYGAVLRPRRLVQVKGAGNAHSGRYYVTRVVHELKGEGVYIQQFTARRNARDLDGTEQFGGSGFALPFPGLA